ncbi:hypothetical protein BsWGS_24556 [Bradybaena similaris]
MELAGRSMHHVKVAALLLLAWAMILCSAVSGKNACQLGWFGSRCQLKCRCQSNKCDSQGLCLGDSKCEGGWFGPACQYVDIAYGKTPYPNVTDADDNTCINDSSVKLLTVDFGGMYPVNWVRMSVSEPGSLDKLRFRLEIGYTYTRCSRLLVYTTNNRQKDILCLFNYTVTGLQIGGLGISYLCSLHVSGGRNVALKQNAQMLGFYHEQSAYTGFINKSFPAELAVDGDTSQDFYKGSSCARSIYSSKPRWSVTLSTPAIVNRFVIYSQNVDLFKLTFFDIVCYGKDGARVFNYTDHTPFGEYVYSIMHASSALIQSLTLYGESQSNVIVLCELEIYGDFQCDKGHYGLECEKRCHCLNTEDCLLSTGECEVGCDSGFLGDDCQTPCPPGLYGYHCEEECSQFCVDDRSENTTCDHVSGTCLSGCQLGYMPPTCAAECDKGTYGPNCKLTCSPACRAPPTGQIKLCNHCDGACYFGCDIGFYGSTCSALCPHNYYGAACKQSCSTGCFHSNDSRQSSCHHVTGVCLYGCRDGYNGSLCEQRLLEQTTAPQSQSSLSKIFVYVVLTATVAAVTCACVALCMKKKRPLLHVEKRSSASEGSESAGIE